MPHYLKAAALALGMTLAAGPAAAIDPFFPGFGNNGIDVLHYNLDLAVAPASGQVTANATLSVVALERLPRFTLDLHGFAVSKVTVNGVPARFSRSNDKLSIQPFRAIPKWRPFRVVVTYAGVPDTIQDPTAPDDPSLTLGWFRYQDASYVVSEPVGASTFFPANDEPTDKASFTIAVTVPAAWTVAANGVLKSVRAIGMSKRFTWEMRQPMTTWLATVHVNKFNLNLTRASDGTPIRVYSTPATPPEDVAGYALAGEMLTYFEQLVGPYPFGSYGSVVVDDPALYYALETQAMSTFPVESADAAIVAHELAHQWFGNSVSIAKWEDLWIAEGTATYFEVVWANRGDAAGFHAEMRDLYDYVAENEVGPAVVDAPEELFTDRTYYRGAMALYALRLTVGERAFFRTLATFTTIYRGRNATSADFIRIAVLVSGKPAVRNLLNAWLYQEAVPPLPGQPPVAAGAMARRAPVAPPDLVGSRCGRGSHRGAPAVCD